MSMISMQVDMLRDRAMRVEIFLEGSTDAIPTDTHIQLRDAADTIWELRNKMCGMVDARERARVLEPENAKLRELVRDMDTCISNGAGCDCRGCPLKDKDGCDYEMRMREMGI